MKYSKIKGMELKKVVDQFGAQYKVIINGKAIELAYRDADHRWRTFLSKYGCHKTRHALLLEIEWQYKKAKIFEQIREDGPGGSNYKGENK